MLLVSPYRQISTFVTVVRDIGGSNPEVNHHPLGRGRHLAWSDRALVRGA